MVNPNLTLKKLRSSKTKGPTIKYFLEGEKQVDIAKDLKISEVNNFLKSKVSKNNPSVHKNSQLEKW